MSATLTIVPWVAGHRMQPITQPDEAAAPVSLELETVRRAATGDQRAQTWLCQRVIPRVRKVTRALVRHTADADDAAQLSLIEILRSARTFRGEASLESWAGRIAARTALRYVKRERRNAEPVLDAPPQLVAPQQHRPMAETLPRNLQHYLDQLPEAQRTAIVLHHALGHSLGEIAQMEGVSPNTIKGRMRLGTATLRKLVRRDQKIGVVQGDGQ